MAKYPIDSPMDAQGIVDAVNYALSGPAGLGQNFAGFSAYTPILIRPTGREPFTLPVTTTLDTSWYLNIPITTIVETPSNPTATIEVTFATPFADPPFQLGDIVTIRNTIANGADPDFYNLNRYVVMTCTTTEVVLAYRNSSQLVNQTWPGLYVTGGFLERDYWGVEVSTDCNGRVSVQGGSDRVFINAQLVLDFDYTLTTPGDFDITIVIDRYKGFPNTEPGSVDYFFTFDGVAAERTFTFSETASGTITDLEAIFTSVIEQDLPFGYYWYLLDIRFDPVDTGLGGLLTDYANDGDYTASGTAATLGSLTTFTGITPTTVTGTGSGAELTFDVYAGGGAYDLATNLSVYAQDPGTGYAVGDQILVTGDQLGGVTPTNDLTLTIAAIVDQSARPGAVTAKLRSLTAQVVKE